MRSVVWVTAALCAFSMPAAAQFAKPEDAVKYRQSAFSVMGTHMGRIYQVVQGRVPYNKDQVARSAQIVDYMGKLPYEAFTPGSDLLESKAKPSIWKEEAKFQQLAKDMQAETAKLAAAANSGNLDNVRSQFRATAKSCDACHDNYREK
jgi:cytochrome c556